MCNLASLKSDYETDIYFKLNSLLLELTLKERNMKQKFVYLSMAALAAMTSFTGCIDNDEPDSVANLRNAKAEEFKANAEKTLAEAGVLEMDALVRKADAAYREYEAAVMKEKAAQEALATAYEELDYELRKAQQDDKIATAAEQAKAELVKAQSATANAKATLEGALASLDKAIKDAAVKLADNTVIWAEGEQATVNKAYAAYVTAQKSVVEKKAAVAKAELAVADAELDPEVSGSAVRSQITNKKAQVTVKETALKSAEKNLSDAKEIGTDVEAIAKKCDALTTENYKLDITIATLKAEKANLESERDAAKEVVAKAALEIKKEWKKADDAFGVEDQKYTDLITNDKETYLAPLKNAALAAKYNWMNTQVASLLTFKIVDSDASLAKTLADIQEGGVYLFTYSGTDTKGGDLKVADLFKHRVTNYAVYNRDNSMIYINWQKTGKDADGVDQWTSSTIDEANVINTLYNAGINSVKEAIDNVRTDDFVKNFDNNLNLAITRAETTYAEQSATRIQSLKAAQNTNKNDRAAAQKVAEDAIKEMMTFVSPLSSADNSYVGGNVKAEMYQEEQDKVDAKALEIELVEAQKKANDALKGAYEANVTKMGGKTISELTEAGYAKIIADLEKAVVDAQNDVTTAEVAVKKLENGEWTSVDVAKDDLEKAKYDLAQAEAELAEAKAVYDAAVAAYTKE